MNVSELKRVAVLFQIQNARNVSIIVVEKRARKEITFKRGKNSVQKLTLEKKNFVTLI